MPLSRRRWDPAKPYPPPPRRWHPAITDPTSAPAGTPPAAARPPAPVNPDIRQSLVPNTPMRLGPAISERRESRAIIDAQWYQAPVDRAIGLLYEKDPSFNKYDGLTGYEEFAAVTRLIDHGVAVRIDEVVELRHYDQALARLEQGDQLGKIVLRHPD